MPGNLEPIKIKFTITTQINPIGLAGVPKNCMTRYAGSRGGQQTLSKELTSGGCAQGRRETMAATLIESDPSVMMGKPVVAGTRITVELILEKLAAGETFEQILDAHPRLTREGILAALEFAAEALRADVIYPIRQTAA